MNPPPQIGWIVATDGAVTKYEPPKIAPPITRSERNAQYRIGLSKVLELLSKAGFYCNSIVQSNTAISLQRGPLMFDVSLKAPGQIAYVTSHIGYDPEKRNATIITAADVMGCDCVIQVIGSRASGASTNPVYIPLPHALPDPAQYVFVNVIRVMQTMVGHSHELSGIDLNQVGDQSHAFIDIGLPGN
jgi:hypothetical protein